ncbi:MAG: diguanylate cyclase [bacterium]|nr:diguanylate cyclase [bacterium]
MTFLAGALVAVALCAIVYACFVRLRARPAATEAFEFRALFEQHPDAVVAIGLDGKIAAVNPAMERFSGYRADELIGHGIADLAPMPDHFERRGLASTFIRDEPSALRGTLCPKGEPTVPISIVTVPIGTGRNLRGIYAILSNASDRVRLEFREAMQRERLATVAEVMARYAGRPDEQVQELLRFAVTSLAADGGAVSFEHAGTLRVEFTFGVAPAVGQRVEFAKTFARLTYGSDHVIAISDTRETKWQEDPATRLYGWHAYIGRTIYAQSQPIGILSIVNAHRRAYPFDQADRDFVHVVASLVGASLERTRAGSGEPARALTDDLTGLPNRAFFNDHLDATLARVRRTGGRIAMLYLALGGVEGVRATHGDEGVSEMLRMVGARLRTLARDGEFVAHLGDDAFAVVQDPCLGDAEAARLAGQMVEAAGGTMLFDGERIRIEVGVGIAIFPSDADDREQLVARALAALSPERTGDSRHRVVKGSVDHG